MLKKDELMRRAEKALEEDEAKNKKEGKAGAKPEARPGKSKFLRYYPYVL